MFCEHIVKSLTDIAQLQESGSDEYDKFEKETAEKYKHFVITVRDDVMH